MVDECFKKFLKKSNPSTYPTSPLAFSFTFLIFFSSPSHSNLTKLGLIYSASEPFPKWPFVPRPHA